MEQLPDKLTPLEEGLLKAMQSLDRQIDKEVQRRRPDQLEESGVQKWEAYSRRVEIVAAHILNWLGEDKVKHDSLVVLAEGLTRALQLFVEELDREGLGELRTSYSESALTHVKTSAERALTTLGRESRLL